MDLFMLKWTILVHFGLVNAKIRFGIRSLGPKRSLAPFWTILVQHAFRQYHGHSLLARVLALWRHVCSEAVWEYLRLASLQKHRQDGAKELLTKFLIPLDRKSLHYSTLFFRINYVWCNVIVYIDNGLRIKIYRRCNSGGVWLVTCPVLGTPKLHYITRFGINYWK